MHILSSNVLPVALSGPSLLPVPLSDCLDPEATVSGFSETEPSEATILGFSEPEPCEQPDDDNMSEVQRTKRGQRTGAGWQKMRRVMGRHKHGGGRRDGREKASKARRLIAKVYNVRFM